MSWELNHSDQSLITLALNEDLGTPRWKDMTCDKVFTSQSATADCIQLISKHPEPIVLCGLPILSAIMEQFTSNYEVTTIYQDGDSIAPQTIIATIKADNALLLMAERTILNFLQHLCAIATLTASFVQQVNHTPMRILDTRKTLPGFRLLINMLLPVVVE